MDTEAGPSAVQLVAGLPAPVVEVVGPGELRAVAALEIVEPGGSAALEPGDLALLVGAATPAAALSQIVLAGPAAGVVVRARAVDAGVRAACSGSGLALLVLADDVTWSQALGLLRSALDQAGSPGAGEDPYADLFALADRVGALLGAPVTIEDAQSRVLAYSTGQHDVDPARTSTIVGRRVPRAVRDHFRARGVFRHLASSDEPILVPAGEDGIRPRFVVPVRAGDEWLGSVWAVVDAPVGEERVEQARLAAQVVALHLLRLRAQHEFHDHLRTSRLRAVLRGEPDAAAPVGDGPWRVAALRGPDGVPSTEERLAVWSGTLRRRGWRAPLLADVDGAVLALVGADTDGPGSWAWLARTCAGEAARQGGLDALAGTAVGAVDDLPLSAALAGELLSSALLGPASVEDRWAELVCARAERSTTSPPLPTPVAALAEHDERHQTTHVATLGAILDHWGDPARAAAALGVHPNTVRNRLARLVEACGLDLYDPTQRLAAWLEVRSRG